jgi:hypothetical protein
MEARAVKHTPLINGEPVSDQVTKLWAMIDAATRCSQLPALRRNDLFGTREGVALVNAMYDLTEVDALYEFARDIEFEFGLGEHNPQEREGF